MQLAADSWSATVHTCFLSGLGIHCLDIFSGFLTRDVMLATVFSVAVSVCLSVCLSVCDKLVLY